MVGSAWAEEGGTRCTEGGRSSGYRTASGGRREGPWVRDPHARRERAGREGGAGRDASCVLGATTDTIEGDSFGILGAWERNRDAAFKKENVEGGKRRGRTRSGRMQQAADVLLNQQR